MERWIIISNCQTYGLAHCLQMLSSQIRVDPVDSEQFRAQVDRYNDEFRSYDRVLISLGAEAVPGADTSQARRVDRVPELTFGAYHPDLIYVTEGGSVVDGPAGAYHSALVFAAFKAGWSVRDALTLFNGRIYGACGYFERWASERDGLVDHCGSFGLDVRDSIRRWGRRRSFMYSVNHPRIEVLNDIARLLLEREGYSVVLSDVLPHDNLVSSSVFPVYPEIGDALGVPGSYLFKRCNEYTQIGLEQFVDESFAVYDVYSADALVAHEHSRPIFDRAAAVLQGERPAV